MNVGQLCFGLFVLAAVLASPGCYYENEQDLYPLDFCDTAAITYSGIIEPIVQANCAIPACHVPGGSGTGDFTSYNGLHGQVVSGRLLPSIMQVSGSAFMPPSGKLSDCDITKITIWVNAGAPQN
ncbi:MAG: hypothetical protein IPN44_15915 [Flavobacteriales bacterium]|nr:hypothetical protein [Flavobacteriales bacterium]